MSAQQPSAPAAPARRAIDDPVALERGARIFRLALARAAAREAEAATVARPISEATVVRPTRKAATARPAREAVARPARAEAGTP